MTNNKPCKASLKPLLCDYIMKSSSEQYDLAIAWTWPYDREFIRSLTNTAAEYSLKVLEVGVWNVHDVIKRVREHTLRLAVMLDRASDESAEFLPLVHLLQQSNQEPVATSRSSYIINPPELIAKAADKATMHLELLSGGVQVPYSIIISPYNLKKELELSLSELSHLGRPFIIKPANTTGGGVGVVTGAETLKDVLDARQHHRNDKYLLQETIKPALIGSRRAWFRVFYAFGEVILCWWDDQTHLYAELTQENQLYLDVSELIRVTKLIQKVCRLDFFSTELSMTTDGKLVAVDYVNEMCDMRPQSIYRDGVPDSVIISISRALMNFVKRFD